MEVGFTVSGAHSVKRPDGVGFTRTGGIAIVELVYNGTTISVYGKSLNVFAKHPLVGTIDGAIDALRLDFGLDLLAADLLSSNPAARAWIADAGTTVVIPSNRNRKTIIPHDAIHYRERNRIECCFTRLKHFRRLATRCDRRVIHYLGFRCLAAAMLWMR